MWLLVGGVFCVSWYEKGAPESCCLPGSLVDVVLRRCATLPCPLKHSTIAVPGLSFRVRNGTGRLPWAMAAAKSYIIYHPRFGVSHDGSRVAGWGPDGGRKRKCVFE